MQERSLARQRRWLFKAQPVARQGRVSFRVRLTFAANDDQRQVSAAADIRYPNLNDRNQSEADNVKADDRRFWPQGMRTAPGSRRAQCSVNAPTNSAAGAASGQIGTPSAKVSHGCFRFTQMCATTRSSLLRSSVPARTTATFGRALFVL